MVQVVKLSSDIISIIVLLHTVCDLARLHVKVVTEFSFLLLPLSAPHRQLRSCRGTWAIMFHVCITIKCFSASVVSDLLQQWQSVKFPIVFVRSKFRL